MRNCPASWVGFPNSQNGLKEHVNYKVLPL